LKPDTHLLHSVWNDSKDFIPKSSIELESNKLDELIASIFSNGPFYFYIVDLFDLQIKYMHSLVKDIHGLDPDHATFQDILDHIHPDDMAFVAKAEAMAFNLMYNAIEKDKRKSYKISYCFRFRTSDGTYKLFNHQAVFLTTDEDGRGGQSLNIHTDISHLTNVNNYQLSFIGLFGEPSYLNVKVLDENPFPIVTKPMFSKREIEIIRLMSEGLTNIEIGNKIFISQNTVKNHRKKILHKAGCKNLGQLITKCITEGLI
jgi:DNA-binding CsgD family transcriptional regulator